MDKKTVTDTESRAHARNTFNELFELGAIPIVNENDTVSTYDIEFGDNDRLSAVVVALIKADLLILLSDIDGLYTDDPRSNPDSEFIPEVLNLDSHFMDMAKGSTGSSFGTGGMATKLIAGDIATSAGAEMIIANADDFHIIHRLTNGEEIGTIFRANPKEEFALIDYLEKM
jgi:glutamate 5-kinase